MLQKNRLLTSSSYTLITYSEFLTSGICCSLPPSFPVHFTSMSRSADTYGPEEPCHTSCAVWQTVTGQLLLPFSDLSTVPEASDRLMKHGVGMHFPLHASNGHLTTVRCQLGDANPYYQFSIDEPKGAAIREVLLQKKCEDFEKRGSGGVHGAQPRPQQQDKQQQQPYSSHF